MRKKKLTDSHIVKNTISHAGKNGHRKAVLVFAVLAGGSYAVYRYVMAVKRKRAQELSELLRSGRQDIRPNDRECASAYFAGYKNGLDDGYDEGYERGSSAGEERGIDDGNKIGYEEALRKCIEAANKTEEDLSDVAEKYLNEEDEINEDNE